MTIYQPTLTRTLVLAAQAGEYRMPLSGARFMFFDAPASFQRPVSGRGMHSLATLDLRDVYLAAFYDFLFELEMRERFLEAYGV